MESTTRRHGGQQGDLGVMVGMIEIPFTVVES
jgi:hypothetical protein